MQHIMRPDPARGSLLDMVNDPLRLQGHIGNRAGKIKERRQCPLQRSRHGYVGCALAAEGVCQVRSYEDEHGVHEQIAEGPEDCSVLDSDLISADARALLREERSTVAPRSEWRVTPLYGRNPI